MRGRTLTGVLVAVALAPAPSVGQGMPAAPQVDPDSVILVGAGDIAACAWDGDDETALLLDTIPGVVFTLGDNAYPRGRTVDFDSCYTPTWGRQKARTRPTPGNHDYATSGAADYFAYFGGRAGDSGYGYYSYTAAGWLVLVLNSGLPLGPESPQAEWLRRQLEDAPACVLAYAHHPLFSSGPHGGSARMVAAWEALYRAGAEVILAGHDHDYERFAPQRPDGTPDPEHGIRAFVVGTGGAPTYTAVTRAANSEAFSPTHGVLKLTLLPGRYRWTFIPVPGEPFADSGSARCH